MHGLDQAHLAIRHQAIRRSQVWRLVDRRGWGQQACSEPSGGRCARGHGRRLESVEGGDGLRCRRH
jgi:hypothetical protein